MAQLNNSPLGLTLDSAVGSFPGYGDNVQIESRFNNPNSNTIVFTPWPEGPMDDTGVPAKRRNIHSDEIYDVRLKNIIDISDSLFTVDKSGNTIHPVKLKAIDFAYLKNVGVYPNNRLMIARRYGSPVVDDPTSIQQSPISTMISWVPDGEDFIKLSFGEEWDNAEADFTEIFNSVGKDIMGRVGSQLGGYLGAGAAAIPLPGFSEGFQRKLMVAMGLASEGSDQYIPAGEPNMIKMAKIRKLVGYGQAGSSLKANISIKMVCEWEQKFISGVDPSIAFMDILNTAFKFGTSPAKFYLGKGGGANVDKVRKFIEGMTNKPLETLSNLLKEISNNISDIVQEIRDALDGKETKGEKNKANLGYYSIKNAIENVLETIAKKYQIRLIGVINSLTGAASTPWHITLGNPLRPVFCSGDMLVENVELSLGPELAFNDLPSTIKVEFTLVNARPLGMDEMLAKFNVGYMRTVTVKKDIYTSQKDSDFIPPDDQLNQKGGTHSPSNPQVQDVYKDTATNGNFQQQSSNMNLESYPETLSSIGETRLGNNSVNTDVINPDANSTESLSQEVNTSMSAKQYQDMLMEQEENKMLSGK